MRHAVFALSILFVAACTNGQIGSTEGPAPIFPDDGGADPPPPPPDADDDPDVPIAPDADDDTDPLDPHEPPAVAVAPTDVIPSEPVCTRGTARDEPVRAIIRDTFGRHGDAALRVAWCESGPWGTTAQNGQYKGLFQMGRYERATYGHGPCAEAQAEAAHRYFVASGRDWSPWACRP